MREGVGVRRRRASFALFCARARSLLFAHSLLPLPPHPFNREMEADEMRLLRAAVGAMYDLVGLATRAVERFGPPEGGGGGDGGAAAPQR